MLDVARSARAAKRSPPRAIASRRVRRDRTKANSAPTKNPLRSTSVMMASSRASTGTRYSETGTGGQGQDHGHSHDGHSHGPGGHSHHHHGSTRRLKIALGITAGFLVAEVAGGLLAHSLTLIADAGHMLTDVAALALALWVAWFSRQPETPQKTYGYLRWEILAAFL